MAGQSRREQRRAKGKSSSLLDGLEDDFLDIEENFKAPVLAEKIATPKDETENKVGTTNKSAQPTTVLSSTPLVQVTATKELEQDSKLGTKWEQVDQKTETSPEPIDLKTNQPTNDPHTLPGAIPVNNQENWEQTENKVGAKREHGAKKTENKVGTNWEQTRNKNNKPEGQKSESGNKVGAKLGTQVETKWEQTENKLGPEASFSTLVGLQRNVVIFLYQACKFARSKSTNPITLEHIAKTLETSSGSVKTTLKRLEKKNCIKRIEFKNGRGGWSKYEMSENLYRAMLQFETGNKLETNREQTGNKVGAKLGTEVGTSHSSSSSYLNINTTTNYKAGASEASSEKWKIEIPKILRDNGFNDGHIDQLARDAKFGIREVEESMAAFAFDLGFDDVKRQIRRPVAMFLALLKRGEPYVSQKGYISDEDRLIQENIERLKKARDEKKKREEELLNLKFDEWVASKSRDELMQIEPPIGDFMGALHRNALKDYYVRNEFRVGEMQ